jgi:hypothetical protein
MNANTYCIIVHLDLLPRNVEEAHPKRRQASSGNGHFHRNFRRHLLPTDFLRKKTAHDIRVTTYVETFGPRKRGFVDERDAVGAACFSETWKRSKILSCKVIGFWESRFMDSPNCRLRYCFNRNIICRMTLVRKQSN